MAAMFKTVQAYEALRGVVFDWAGTMVDHGSRAPAAVFQEIFRRRGVPISAAQAREPMGRAKRDHIAAIVAMPPVAAAWQQRYGSVCGEAEIEAMYRDFLPLQRETLHAHCDLIPGAAEIAEECRRAGLRIGSSTGYTRELMEIVVPAAARQGYAPELVLCAEDAPRGRPAPYLLYLSAIHFDIYPMWRMVKVDDTCVGIEAGRNAGCWTVGVTRTGNELGLSLEELAAISDAECRERCERAANRLKSAGADYTVASVADLSDVLREIDERTVAGDRPGEAPGPKEV